MKLGKAYMKSATQKQRTFEFALATCLNAPKLPSWLLEDPEFVRNLKLTGKLPKSSLATHLHLSQTPIAVWIYSAYGGGSSSHPTHSRVKHNGVLMIFFVWQLWPQSNSESSSSRQRLARPFSCRVQLSPNSHDVKGYLGPQNANPGCTSGLTMSYH